MNAINSIPDHLKPYVSTQNYSQYTAEDQAAWRYIMRQSRDYFKDHAHETYIEGLEKTAIPITHIPRIDNMNRKLSEFGWGAVGVTGFIPPAAFLEFQALKLLPIATDMRSIDHIAYTPAPDIVHEAAGHAPIIANPGYRNYLTKYATLANKAIFSDQDVQMFEAIRMLSDLKENSDATKEEIAKAERELEKALNAFSFTSETAQITRMYWWTAEYGLIKNNNSYHIYGAGLLSSIGESQRCLSKEVKKVPMSLACIHQGFNITEPQPQLFVADSFKQLEDILDEMSEKMAYKIGGLESLEKAKKAKAITTTLLDSEISISGILDNFLLDEKGSLSFIKWRGPSQICFKEKEMQNQGIKRHPEGFSSPLGRLEKIPSKHPSKLSLQDLTEIGLNVNRECQLNYTSGFQVKGKVKNIVEEEDYVRLITWADCTVTKDGETFFMPEWGEFDMILGSCVPSVFGGPMDRASFELANIGTINSTPHRKTPYSKDELKRFELFSTLRELREKGHSTSLENELKELAQVIGSHFGKQWLLSLEVLELVVQKLEKPIDELPWAKKLKDNLLNPSNFDKEKKELIEKGLRLLKTTDS